MLQTVASFLEQVYRRGFIPASQNTFTEAEILTIASEELRSIILPEIVKTYEEFYVHYKDITLVSGTKGYDIPEHSYNSTIREIQLIENQSTFDLPRFSLEAANKYSDLTSGRPIGFYVQNDQIMIQPTPNTTGTLRVYYVVTTPNLVAVDQSAVISAIDTATKVVSVSSIPSSWVTGDVFDFISKKAGHRHKGVDFTSTLVSGTDITFSSLPDGLSIGDYISLTGESSLLPVPYTMIPVLAQLTAAALLDYSGQSGAQEAQQKGMGLLQAAIKTLTPRVTGEQVHIMQKWF